MSTATLNPPAPATRPQTPAATERTLPGRTLAGRERVQLLRLRQPVGPNPGPLSGVALELYEAEQDLRSLDRVADQARELACSLAWAIDRVPPRVVRSMTATEITNLIARGLGLPAPGDDHG